MTTNIEIEHARDELMKLHPAPWFLDRCNAEGVEVLDTRGNIVFAEEFDTPAGAAAHVIEDYTRGRIALAKYLVAMSGGLTKDLVAFTIKCESGIPIPARSSCLGNAAAEQLKEMKVGDSFLWNGHPTVPYRGAKRLGFELMARKINGEGVRYWRTK